MIDPSSLIHPHLSSIHIQHPGLHRRFCPCFPQGQGVCLCWSMGLAHQPPAAIPRRCLHLVRRAAAALGGRDRARPAPTPRNWDRPRQRSGAFCVLMLCCGCSRPDTHAHTGLNKKHVLMCTPAHTSPLLPSGLLPQTEQDAHRHGPGRLHRWRAALRSRRRARPPHGCARRPGQRHA